MINNESLVFIKDINRIWTHGTFFPGIYIYTFTIVPKPEDATVIINGKERTSVQLWYGDEVSWEVSKDGYTTQSGTLTLDVDMTLNVDLKEPEPFTFVYESKSMKIVQGTVGNYSDLPAVFAIDGAYDIEINGTMIEDIEETMSFNSYLESSGNIVKIYPHDGTTVNHAYKDYPSDDDPCQAAYISEVNSWGDAVFGDVSHLFTGRYGAELSDIYSIIKSVPPLSKGFSKCEDFSYFFYMCSSLTTLPENLFSNCTSVTSFSSCFDNCTSLTSIPESLFSNNTAVTDFSYCFYSCTSLTSIPENLFANCTSVTDFSYCFYQCNLSGESAYDIVDINGQSEKIHLYERVNYPDIYTAPTSYRWCYYNQTNLDDYDAANAAGWC